MPPLPPNPLPPPRPWYRRLPVEWALAIALAGLTLVPLLQGRFRVTTADILVYYHLTSAFTSGVLLVLGWLWCEVLRRALPAPWSSARAGRLTLVASAVAIATLDLLLRDQADTPGVVRLLEAAVIGTAVPSLLLGLFAPVAGLLSWRTVFRTAGGLLLRWLPWYAGLIATGFWLSLLRPLTPLVWDPLLLRMDVSFGFNPGEAVFAAVADLRIVEWLSVWGYPLLGLLLAGVAARLQLAGAAAQARRALLAYLLATSLALVCYRIVPAIGPILAFPGLYPHPVTEAATVLAEQTRAAALAAPPRLTGDPVIVRNVFPSLHVGFTLLALAAARGWNRRLFRTVLPFGLVQIATTLTLGVHYLVDLVAAVPFACLCWWLADRGVRLTGPPAGDLPPLPARPRRAATAWFFLSLGSAGAALFLWARFAPLSPWLTWPLAALIMAAPAWTLRRALDAPPASSADIPPARSGPRWERLLQAGVFCSGGLALVLEQVFEKYLATVIGASRPAATVVLAVFFAGLALGAALCPKSPAGAARRLAGFELFLAAWTGFVLLGFFPLNESLVLALAGPGTGGLGPRILIAGFWLLPPAVAMGAQLPTLAAFLAAQGGSVNGRGLAHFYSLNLAGAGVFTLLTPPLLFNFVGVDGALIVVGALSVAIGLAYALWLPRAAPAAAAPTRSPAAPPVSARWLALAAAAGFVFFALEVIWFHLISAVAGASVSSFSLLLGLVLLALALGGRQVARLRSADDDTVHRRLRAVLGWALPVLVLGSALWPWLGRGLAAAQGWLGLRSFAEGELLKFLGLALPVLPAAALLGQVFPLVLRAADRAPADGSPTGRVCLANVLGCATGAFVTGFVLIPAIGAEVSLALLAALVGTGWLLLSRPARTDWRAWPGPAVAAILFLLLPRWDRLELTRGFGVHLAPVLPESLELRFFAEDFRSGFVTVVAPPATDGGPAVRTLLQNGKFDADDGAEQTAQIDFGLLAAMHAPARARALVIGCGSGQTAAVIARLGFDQVEIAELSPGHLAAARTEFSHLQAGALDRPGVRIFIEDGRHHLLRSTGGYDVIQIEVTSVWFAGATNLYSREFYALARHRLSPGGVLAQWVQLHHLTPRELAVLFRTLQAEFPHVSLWRAGHQACLLASDRSLRPNAAAWDEWLASPDLAAERALSGIDSPAILRSRRLADESRLSRLTADRPPVLNTDRNRWLEFQTPRYYLSRRNHVAENLRWLTE